MILPPLCAALAVALAVIGGYLLGRAPIGYTSRWHVPTSTVYDDLRYSLAKPVRCESRHAVEQAYGRLQRLPSESRFSRFTADAPDQPVYIWLTPAGHNCLVAYHQYYMVG